MTWQQNRPPYGPPGPAFPGRPPTQLHHPPPQAWMPPAQGIHPRPPSLSLSGAVAPTWTEHTNAEGRKYYFNTISHKSSWEKPEELMSPEEKALAACPWKEYTTPEGKKYYSHAVTKESKWEMPEEYKTFLEKAKQEKEKAERASPSLQSPRPPPSPISAISITTGPTGGTPPPQFSQMQMSGPGPIPGKPLVPPPISPVGVSPVGFGVPPLNVHSQPMVPAPVVDFATKEEAEEAFMNLLKSSGVRPSWTWEQTMRAIITHPHYRALKTLAERKHVFHQYVEETAKRETEEREEKAKKMKEDYLAMLQSQPEINSSIRWRKAIDILSSHPAFQAVPDERQREDWFEDYVQDLRRREKDELRDLRKQSMDRFSNYLRSIPEITMTTTWRDAQRIYTSQLGFSVDSYKGMDATDFLAVFEEYASSLNEKYYEARDKWLIDRRRQERRNRDGFKALLEEIRSRGAINAKTKWMEVYPLMKDDERYKNILGQPGSTPLELFWDVIEELDDRFYQQKKVVYEVLKDTGFEVTTETSYASFQAHVTSDERVAVVEPENLKLSFDYLQAKAAHKLREERRRQEKRLRRKMDAFKSVLKRVEPAIVLESTWEEVRQYVLRLILIWGYFVAPFVLLCPLSVIWSDRHVRQDVSTVNLAILLREIRSKESWHMMDHKASRRRPWYLTHYSHCNTVRPKVEDKSEFKAFDNEEQRVEAFDRYLKRLKEKQEERSRHSGAEDGKEEEEEGTVREEEGELVEEGHSRARKSSHSSGKHSGPNSANGNGSRKHRHHHSSTNTGRHRDSDRESGHDSVEEEGERRKRKKRSHRHGSLSADDMSSAEEGEAFDDDDDYHRFSSRRRHHGSSGGGDRSDRGRPSSSKEDRKEKRRDVTASAHLLDVVEHRSVSASSKTENGGGGDVEMEEGEAVDD